MSEDRFLGAALIPEVKNQPDLLLVRTQTSSTTLQDLQMYVKGRKMSEDRFLGPAFTPKVKPRSNLQCSPSQMLPTTIQDWRICIKGRLLAPSQILPATLSELQTHIKGRHLSEHDLFEDAQKSENWPWLSPNHAGSCTCMTTPTLATQQAWPLSLTRRLLDLVRMKSQQAVVCGRKPEQQIVCANRSHETQETIRSYLPLEIGGITERALADTGAQGNIMCEALARELHLRVSKSTTEDIRFVNAVGEPVKQIGHTTIRCTVGGTGPPHTMVARFWVVAKLVERLVVGREFLESTETLTKFRHRLQKVVVDKISGSRVLHSGQPRWRINCVVNGERMLANPDTGSDLDLMSLSYVQRCGLRLHRPELDCQHVEFADSSQKNLSGFVLVPFCFGSSHASGADQVLRRFYVLNGLTCDVLIGNNTLEEFDAFATFRNELVEVEEYDAYSDFQLIRWVQKSGEADILDQSFRDFNISFNPTASKPAQKPRLSVLSRLRSLISRRQNSKCCRPMTVEESQALLDQYLRYQDLKESRRRKIESDRIAKLPLSASQERASAEAEEAALKDQYERDRSDFMARHGAIQKLVNSPVHLGSVGVPNVDSEH